MACISMEMTCWNVCTKSIITELARGCKKDLGQSWGKSVKVKLSLCLTN
jgi:hypothetical protein